ncbi:NifU family protein [Mycolicibacterium novocastrense]|nr:NifU family protein [Mycolicibacterium novocastrense]
MSTPMLHPENTADPRLLRWITPGRELPADCPGLAALVADGTLQRVRTSPGAVETLLSDDRSWSVDGPRVRSALFAALASPEADAPMNADEMRRRVEQIIDREVAPVAGSHGGSITVESVIDGVVTVDFGGACAGCTLRGAPCRISSARPCGRGIRRSARCARRRNGGCG